MAADPPHTSEKQGEQVHTSQETGGTVPAADGDVGSDQDSLDQEAQAGVKGIQAATKVWTKGHLVLAYAM
jgi:hypothetical protein